MIRVKNKKTHVFMLILLLILGIGFAALAATLKINGTITIDSAKWDVHFENVEVAQGSVTATTVPTSDDATTTEMTYAVDFTQPGDFYEFTVDIANDGTIDAMVNLVTNKVYAADGETEKQLPAYLSSTVTYVDGAPISKNQLLSKQTSEKIKVRVEFRSDVDASELPSTNETTIFKFSSTFKQADDTSCQRPTTFENDSWDVIQCNVKNNPSSYPVGATKNIEMDIDGDNTNETYTLRVANNTTPSECSQEGFSQTACGFVIEFKDIIARHRMNPSGDSNIEGYYAKGGWEYSDMRAYLNSKKYLNGEIDYTNTGIYSILPSDLKSKIIDTIAVSGYGSEDTKNFITTDKLYLFSPHEIWEDVDGNTSSGLDYYDKSYSNTRQLDYYKAKGVTTSNYSEAKKIRVDNGSEYYWWLRSAYSSDFFFHVVGNFSFSSSPTNAGVSPAFRIG